MGVRLAVGGAAQQTGLILTRAFRAEIAGFIAQSLRGETLPCR